MISTTTTVKLPISLLNEVKKYVKDDPNWGEGNHMEYIRTAIREKLGWDKSKEKG